MQLCSRKVCLLSGTGGGRALFIMHDAYSSCMTVALRAVHRTSRPSNDGELVHHVGYSPIRPALALRLTRKSSHRGVRCSAE